MSTIELVSKNSVYVPKHDLKALQDEAVQINEKRGKLLPVEASTLGNWMDARMREIRTQVSESQAYVDHGKPILDQQVLRWRHTSALRGIPVPRLALLNPFQGNKLTIHRNAYQDGFIRQQYADVINEMEERSEGRRRVTSLTFTWKGVLPNEIRDLIHSEKDRFERIYMLTEAPRDQWVLRETMEPRPRPHLDPLVLGMTSHQVLVVLAQFDPTPLEEYVSTEFATRQLTTGK